MSNRWDRPGVPHKGWHLIRTDDIGEAEHTCEMCGQVEIRYVHEIRHPAHHPLLVGCVCAERLTGDVESPKAAERRLKNLARRRKKWVDEPWRVSRAGNEYRIVHGISIGVNPSRFHLGRWNWRIGGTFSYDLYADATAAKGGLFDEVERLKAS